MVAGQREAQLHLHCDQAQPLARGPGPCAARRRCQPGSLAFLVRRHLRPRFTHSQPLCTRDELRVHPRAHSGRKPWHDENAPS